MPAKVVFRGLILFRTNEVNGQRKIVEAVFPDTQRTPQDSSNKRNHCDNTYAVPHHPGLLLWKGKKALLTRVLTNVHVDFNPPDVPAYVDASVLSTFPNIESPKGHGNPHEPLRYASALPASTRIDMRMAVAPTRASATHVSPGFHFGTLHDLPTALELEFANPIDVRLHTATSTSPETVTVRNGETLYLYHDDEEAKTEEDLTVPQGEPNAGSVDIDFKWLYSLVQPTAGTLTRWAANDLNAPYYHPPLGPRGPIHITVSTCFPGWI